MADDQHPDLAPGSTWPSILDDQTRTGAAAPAGPDPDRDRRIDAYRDRERRRAARALDRHIEGLVDAPKLWSEATDVAGERFVEAVGDYVLARLGEHAGHNHLAELDEYCVQQKADYGVRCGAPGPCYLEDCARDASGTCPR